MEHETNTNVSKTSESTQGQPSETQTQASTSTDTTQRTQDQSSEDSSVESSKSTQAESSESQASTGDSASSEPLESTQSQPSETQAQASTSASDSKTLTPLEILINDPVFTEIAPSIGKDYDSLSKEGKETFLKQDFILNLNIELSKTCNESTSLKAQETLNDASQARLEALDFKIMGSLNSLKDYLSAYMQKINPKPIKKEEDTLKSLLESGNKVISKFPLGRLLLTRFSALDPSDIKRIEKDRSAASLRKHLRFRIQENTGLDDFNTLDQHESLSKAEAMKQRERNRKKEKLQRTLNEIDEHIDFTLKPASEKILPEFGRDNLYKQEEGDKSKSIFQLFDSLFSASVISNNINSRKAESERNHSDQLAYLAKMESGHKKRSPENLILNFRKQTISSSAVGPSNLELLKTPSNTLVKPISASNSKTEIKVPVEGGVQREEIIDHIAKAVKTSGTVSMLSVNSKKRNNESKYRKPPSRKYKK